jgi:hypothetical protein
MSSVISTKSKPLFGNGFSYLLVSDFDQTLRSSHSGYVLWGRLAFVKYRCSAA